MIVRDRPNALRLFFVVKGALIQRIWPQLLGVGLLSTAIVAAHRQMPGLVPGVNPAAFALIGVAISIFLSFRNNASYDRWWEARKLWGQIIETSRSIARQTAVLSPDPERRAILENVIAFAQTTVHQLRGKPRGPAPDAILSDTAVTVARLLRAGRLDQVEALALNESLSRLTHALVGCERLANTPVPFPYTLLLHRTAYIFCFMMPFGLADSLGWATPLAVMLVAYNFFGLDALAEELEEPFGTMPNDLPLSAYATVIERHMRAALGDELPEAPAPKDYVLT
ncbi:bestrophin family protein [Paenirhodobacter sp.]|uniref:bestrophin family protein n=1 Tax=Paenirhodobacter sp. TaxID=1965326 RepID=UPI003B3F901E